MLASIAVSLLAAASALANPHGAQSFSRHRNIAKREPEPSNSTVMKRGDDKRFTFYDVGQ
jgi:hypothetical protein